MTPEELARRLVPTPLPPGLAETWVTERMQGVVGYGLRVKRTVCSERTPFQQIDLVESYHHGKALLLDGCLMLTELDEFIYHEMMAHVGAQTVAALRRAVVVGGGDGGVVRELLKYPGLEVALAEIDERVVRLSQEHIPSCARALDDPRVTLAFEDGAEYLARLPERSLDLIVVDGTDPVGPAGSLVTEGFYARAARALALEGVFVAQTQSPFYHAPQMREMYATLSRVFRQVHMFWAVCPAYVGFLWTFCHASHARHPLEHFRPQAGLHRRFETRYYSADVHRSAFALPPFVAACLPEGHPQRG